MEWTESYWGYQWNRSDVLCPPDRRTTLSECRTGSDSLNVRGSKGSMRMTYRRPIWRSGSLKSHGSVNSYGRGSMNVGRRQVLTQTGPEVKRCGAALNGRGTGCGWKVAGSVIKNRETLRSSPAEIDDNSLNVNRQRTNNRPNSQKLPVCIQASYSHPFWKFI